MKKILVIMTLLLSCGLLILFFCEKKKTRAEKEIAQILVKQVQDFQNVCDSLGNLLDKHADEKSLQECFLRARLEFKRFEWAAEYFEPAPTRFVNGPPVPEVEETGQAFEPAGLQVMEGFLFPHLDHSKASLVRRQIDIIKSKCKTYQSHFENVEVFNWQIFDAVKLEVFRIETIGMAGFDNPLTLKSAEESSTAFKSLQNVVSHYPDNNTDNLAVKFNDALAYLASHADFDAFDRAEFILNYCNALTTGISDLQNDLKLAPLKYNRLLNQDAKTLFDTNAFNANAYSPDMSSFATKQKIALGKKLFYDPILSGDGKRSCASCHHPERAFTDGLVKNTEMGSGKKLARNTPTLINAALQAGQFYDLRVNNLENQSHDVVQNALEMHGSIIASAQTLWNDSTYKMLFLTAFPKGNRTAIDTLEVMNAIGSYVRSLILLNSRFDQYMRGNKGAITIEERNGFNLFMGKAKCATCHYLPLFNGTLPPRYMKTEVEVIGVPESIAEDRLDSDLGRYNIMKSASLRHAFKIPTVRNVSLTGPYMHNGVFTTLEQVIDFYDKGGGAGLGLRIENQTLSPEKLNLSEKEKRDLIGFLKTLDG